MLHNRRTIKGNIILKLFAKGVMINAKNIINTSKNHDDVEKLKTKPPHTWNIELSFLLSLFEAFNSLYFLSPSGTKLGQLLPSKSNLLSAILSERGHCEASLKSSVSKLKGVTKKRPECPHTFFLKI